MIKSSKIFDRVYTNFVETFNADPAGCCVRISTYLPPLLKGESSLSRTPPSPTQFWQRRHFRWTTECYYYAPPHEGA